MQYKQGDLPANADGLIEFFRVELQKIQKAMASSQPALFLDTLYASPARVFEGMIVLADGTLWNPGSGAGFYGYRGGAWRLLG